MGVEYLIFNVGLLGKNLCRFFDRKYTLLQRNTTCTHSSFCLFFWKRIYNSLLSLDLDTLARFYIQRVKSSFHSRHLWGTNWRKPGLLKSPVRVEPVLSAVVLWPCFHDKLNSVFCSKVSRVNLTSGRHTGTAVDNVTSHTEGSGIDPAVHLCLGASPVPAWECSWLGVLVLQSAGDLSRVYRGSCLLSFKTACRSPSESARKSR